MNPTHSSNAEKHIQPVSKPAHEHLKATDEHPRHGKKLVTPHLKKLEVPKSAQEPQKATHPIQKHVITTASLFSMRNFDAEQDLPIVYSTNYNMTMAGVELLHNFDTKKYAKLAQYLSHDFLDTPFARPLKHDEAVGHEEDHSRQRKLRFLAPNRCVNTQELEIHHSPSYIEQIHNDKGLIARITETWILNLVPQYFIDTRILAPVKWQLAGTIFATHLAMQHGWAINLGGGFHQGSASHGETFCLFSDILLTMKYVWRKHPLQKFMIIDLDAHQATGIERDLIKLEPKRRKMVYMLDIFNDSIQPPDSRAESGTDLKVKLSRFTGDETYFSKLEQSLSMAFENFKPTLIIYVAGQDILKDDQLGLMNVSDEGLKKRDELVFSWATERKRCPILMLLGGGYLARGARVQADSIRNLFNKGLIWGGHRSGSRTLSRPRKLTNKTSKISGGSNVSILSKSDSADSGQKVVEKASQVAPLEQNPTNQQRKTQVIRVAPIGSKFAVKKFPANEAGKKA